MYLSIFFKKKKENRFVIVPANFVKRYFLMLCIRALKYKQIEKSTFTDNSKEQKHKVLEL